MGLRSDRRQRTRKLRWRVGQVEDSAGLGEDLRVAKGLVDVLDPVRACRGILDKMLHAGGDGAPEFEGVDAGTGIQERLLIIGGEDLGQAEALEGWEGGIVLAAGIG